MEFKFAYALNAIQLVRFLSRFPGLEIITEDAFFMGYNSQNVHIFSVYDDSGRVRVHTDEVIPSGYYIYKTLR